MATEKQIQANRQNAQLAGVKTEEGKKISRMNAIKHGFFSHIVMEYDKVLNTKFYEEILEYFLPQNVYETQLVEIILSNILSYRRICMVESAMLENQFDRGHYAFSMEGLSYRGKSLTDELLKFQRYKTSALNSITKAQHELERLIRTRKGEPVAAPAICDINISGQ
jgi:hypothetical protein